MGIFFKKKRLKDINAVRDYMYTLVCEKRMDIEFLNKLESIINKEVYDAFVDNGVNDKLKIVLRLDNIVIALDRDLISARFDVIDELGKVVFQGMDVKFNKFLGMYVTEIGEYEKLKSKSNKKVH